MANIEQPQPCKMNDLQGVADLKSCLQLTNTNLPQPQRGPVKQQERDKKQKTRCQKSSSSVKNTWVFGGPITPAQQPNVTKKSQRVKKMKSAVIFNTRLAVKNEATLNPLPSITFFYNDGQKLQQAAQSAEKMKAESALPADAHSAGKNEKPPTVENKEQHAVAPKPLSTIAEEEPQQAADKKSSIGSEVSLEQPKQALLQTPETDPHLLLGMKDDQISKLVKEKAGLLREVEQLKDQLNNQTSEELINQKSQWEEEKSYLLNWVNTEVRKYMEANSWLQANLSHVQNMLENERRHWYQERSYLMEYITAMRQGTNLKEEESINNVNLHVDNQGSEDLHSQEKSVELVSDREQTVIQEPSCLTAPGEEASGHGAQEPQPANPWKNNFQGVPELNSCLQLKDTDFPELQRGPVKQQEQGTNHHTRPQKKTFRQHSVFGLTGRPEQQPAVTNKSQSSEEKKTVKKLPAVETKEQSAVTPKPLSTIAEEEPQQAADKKSSTGSEVNLDQPKQTLLPIPGTGLHLLVRTKNGKNGKNEKLPAVETKEQSAVTPKPLPTIAEEEPQQAADKKSSTGSEVNLDQPKKALLPIPGTGLHLLVRTKVGKTDELVKEKAGLLTKLEELKDQLKIQKSKDLSHRSQCKEAISNLKADLIQVKTDLENQKSQWNEEKSHLLTEHTEAASKMKATLINDLEKNMENERRQWEEERSRLLTEHADTSISLRGTLIQVKNDLANERSKWENEKSHLLAQHIEAASSLKATLTQELENKRCQWENEKCHLLTKHTEAISSLKAAFTQAKENMDNERQQWNKERCGLLESIRTTTQAVTQKEEQRTQFTSGLMEKLNNLENQTEEVQKKPKKKSLKKRFLKLFKKSGSVNLT